MTYVSPEALYARVKETLSSYFDSNLVDDLMFPNWLDRALSKFQMGSYPIKEAYLTISNYKGCLPDDINKIKCISLCTDVVYKDYQLPSSFYYQKDCRVTNINDSCEPCFELPDLKENFCDPCERPYVVTNKITNTIYFSYRDVIPLVPATNKAKECCSKDFKSIYHDGNTFDITDDKITVEFPEGTVYIEYFSTGIDNGERVIPDNQYVQDYIENYFYYRIFELLFHSATDETFNQSLTKLQYYRQLSEESYIIAVNKLKLPTKEDISRSIINTRHRYDNFKIPKYGRKRESFLRNYRS